jgi:hypothetical protein
LVVTEFSAGDGDFYNVQTSLLSTSNIITSNLLSHYVDATTILGSNIYILHEFIDRSNVPIVDSNGKIDWVRLKNSPESDSGLDIFNLAQSAYDLAQLGYVMYQQLQSLLGNTPALPNNIKDPISDALSVSNETSSNGFNVAWERVFCRPLAASNNSIGIKKDLYLSDLSKMFVIPTGNFSGNNGSLYNSTTTSNLLIDFTTHTMYPQMLSMGSNQFSSSNVQLGMINLVGSGISTSCNVPLSIASQIITNNISNTSNILTKFIIAKTLCNTSTLSNGSNAFQDLSVASSCNLNLTSFSNGFIRLTSSNLNISESNFKWIQNTSNANPFLTNSTTGLQLNQSNVVIRNLNGSNYSTWVQDFGGVSLTMSYSNGSNQITNNLTIDSNLNISNVNSLSIKSNINIPALATTNSNVFVNSDLSTGKDVICGRVVRSSVMQIGTGIQATKSMTPGLYGDNARLILDS